MFDEHTVIRGDRDSSHTLHVRIDGTELSAARSQMVVNHSPDGFEAGYGGSGPAQLALAILLEFMGQEHRSRAVRMHQAFKDEFITRLPDDGWIITGAQVINWLSRQNGIVRALTPVPGIV
jgi:hypothetical protein